MTQRNLEMLTHLKTVAGTTNFVKVDVEFTFEATFTVKDTTNKVKVQNNILLSAK